MVTALSMLWPIHFVGVYVWNKIEMEVLSHPQNRSIALSIDPGLQKRRLSLPLFLSFSCIIHIYIHTWFYSIFIVDHANQLFMQDIHFASGSTCCDSSWHVQHRDPATGGVPKELKLHGAVADFFFAISTEGGFNGQRGSVVFLLFWNGMI